MSNRWTRGHTPGTHWIHVRYATWRIVDHIVGQRLRIRLVQDSVVLTSDSNRQRRKGEGERRWEAVESSWFQQKGGRGEDESRGWVLESKGGGGLGCVGEQGLGGGVWGGGVVPI